MKAIVWTAYGPPEVLQLREVEKPAPKAGQVLIRIHASTVTTGDCEARGFKFPLWLGLPMRIYTGIRRPERVTILGQELAGEVEAVGGAVTRFKPGDQVFSNTSLRFGAYAQYICLPETAPVLKPANMTFEEAATIPTGGINGLHFLRKANVRSGDQIVIYGAGGSIGTYAVQIAKAWGAEITAVDTALKLDMLKSLGAEHAIDYMREDFSSRGVAYDAIIDVVGKSSFSGCIRSLKPHGRYVLGNPNPSGMLRGLWISSTTGKKVIFTPADYRAEEFASLVKLIESGKVRSVIDRSYPLEETAEAHRYVETGQKKGNVVITINQEQR